MKRKRVNFQKEKETRVNLWLVLPEEIITLITTSLDLTSMIKCMRVCKRWRNLISDLISDNPLVAKGQSLVYDYDYHLARFGALDDDTNQIAWMCGEPHLKRVAYFMSSCNGLVCFLSDDNSIDICICNPLTGECISTPRPQRRGDAVFIYQCSLGFCSSSNEYKLTCLTSDTLETYTLGSPAGWRSIPFDKQKLRGLWRGAICVDGVSHWLLETRSILTFDLAKEVLGSVPPPGLDDDKKIYQLECMDNCLVVTAGCNDHPPLGLEKWVRKEDKSSGELVWTKNWVIDAAQQLTPIEFYWLMPHKISTDGCLIMRDQGNNLYSYDSRDKLVRHHSDCNQFGGRLCSYYTPTLISPKKIMQKTD